MFTLDLDPQNQLEYLAEGAANVVYKIRTPPPSPGTAADINFESHDYDSSTPLPSEIPPLRIDPVLEGKLVRLRKNVPSAVPALESQMHFEQLILPLFPSENIVQQTLFRPTSVLLADCNRKLLAMENQGTRPPKRHGTYLVTSESHGCLVTDMTPPTSSHLCYEFKPKWLVQSPSAPPGSRRCRTCALRAMKRADGVYQSGFCPLDLVSLDRAKVENAVKHIMGLDHAVENARDQGDVAVIKGRLVELFHKNPLLGRLREVQLELDPGGVLSADLASVNFLAAMTLRDCTFFLRLRTHSISEPIDQPIETRLGDLDLKSSHGQKASYWLRVERQLIEGGWYTATEEGGAVGENHCQLA